MAKSEVELAENLEKLGVGVRLGYKAERKKFRGKNDRYLRGRLAMYK